MTLKQAVAVAVKALARQMQKRAFDRQMFLAGSRTPETNNARRDYEQARQAIAVLRKAVK